MSYSYIYEYNFILILREAFEVYPRCMFATNNSSLMLMGQETCDSAAPCARVGYEFSSNNMTFQLPAILRAEHPGEADFLICKAISQHQGFFFLHMCESGAAAFRITVKPWYCSLTSFMSLF